MRVLGCWAGVRGSRAAWLPYDKVKRLVVPDALKVLRLQHGHRYCQLGALASSIGWKHREAVEALEAKRKVKSAAYYEAKKKLRALRAKAEAVQGTAARYLRARAVAKLRPVIDNRSLSGGDRAALMAALAQAWMPLPDDLRDPDLSLRQLMRAAEAQAEAIAVPSAETHLGMAEIALALGRHPLCADGPTW